MKYSRKSYRDLEKDSLRSPKIRKILSNLPASLEKWGIAVILSILISLVIALTLIPFPYSKGESIIHHLITQ